MPLKCTVVVLMLNVLIGAAASAQAPNGATTAPEKPLVISPTADNVFKPLQDEFARLYMSLQNKGGVSKEDRAVLEALREKMAAFSRQFPDDSRGPAAQLYLSIWLEDEDRVDALYGDILRTRPKDIETRMLYAKRLENHNRYPTLIEVLSGAEWDNTYIVDARTMLSNALFAEHRFQEAIDALASIPESAWPSNLTKRPEVDAALNQRKEYVTFWEAEQALRAAEKQADDLPRVEIVTVRGPIVVELFENEAPNTVANFIKLAEAKFYDNTKFHRVLPNFMAQGGDPLSKPGSTGTPGMGNPGYFIADEASVPNARKHFTGSLAMAKSPAPDSGGCQFYLTHLPTPWLNNKHTVYGRVLTGEDLVRSLKQDEVIETINVIRKRDHVYEPKTLPLEAPPATVPTTSPAGDIGLTRKEPIPTKPESPSDATTIPAVQP